MYVAVERARTRSSASVTAHSQLSNRRPRCTRFAFGSERARLRLSVVANVHVGRHRVFRPELICAPERLGRCAVSQTGEHPPVNRARDRAAHRVAQLHRYDRMRSVLKASQVHEHVKGYVAKQFVELSKLSFFVIGGHGGQ